MKIRKPFRTLLFSLAAFLLPTLASAELKEEPELTIAGNEIVISNVTPGAVVTVAGAMQTTLNYVAFEWINSTELVADPTGSATWTLEWQVPTLSVWVAVDRSTGKFATLAVADPTTQQRSFTVSPLVEISSVGEAFLMISPARQDVILVRPGVGSWKATTEPDTSGGTNFAINPLVASGLVGLGETTALPPTPQVGDVLVAIDSARVAAFVKKLVATDIVSQ